ncbi:NUDIX domain-containing protein [Haloferax sp. MBLA0076]|uniref:NUDIX domain-containing protein n=1 Tax=Haloferax litoreum TaxID=2666140 RepID=A0A6A8GC68_9EURY|nr:MULTISPECIES: CoA pyrophosphatase [Haloferax]KAB1192194.1 CoA pyrophosphatase [Haloferax sp. CBA1148]MRX20645.1 NUDIX domain-containing protein [Haloferax litoreum]
MDLAGVTRHEPVTVEAGRRAAVIAPVLFRDERPHVLFTKRADHLGEHPGQMSFPGGGREPADADLRATALRESNEEIGLRSEEVTFHGQLDDILTITDYSVTPFVATIPDREYDPDHREVAEIAALAVDDLTDRSNYESELRDHPKYGEIRLHFFHVDGYTVWGATGRMLVQLLELTTEWNVPPEVDRVVDPDADYPV